MLVICLIVVLALVGVGMYTSVGQGVVNRLSPVEVGDVSVGSPDDVGAFDVLPEDPALDDSAFIPDVYTVEVDSVLDREDGYTAFVTRVDNGWQYEMPVSPSDLGAGYVSMEAGDLVYVEVNSVLERDPPDPSVLYPISVTVQE